MAEDAACRGSPNGFGVRARGSCSKCTNDGLSDDGEQRARNKKTYLFSAAALADRPMWADELWDKDGSRESKRQREAYLPGNYVARSSFHDSGAVSGPEIQCVLGECYSTSASVGGGAPAGSCAMEEQRSICEGFDGPSGSERGLIVLLYGAGACAGWRLVGGPTPHAAEGRRLTGGAIYSFLLLLWLPLALVHDPFRPHHHGHFLPSTSFAECDQALPSGPPDQTLSYPPRSNTMHAAEPQNRRTAEPWNPALSHLRRAVRTTRLHHAICAVFHTKIQTTRSPYRKESSTALLEFHPTIPRDRDCGACPSPMSITSLSKPRSCQSSHTSSAASAGCISWSNTRLRIIEGWPSGRFLVFAPVEHIPAAMSPSGPLPSPSLCVNPITRKMPS
ncbi:hypothetical protein ANO11243_044420 [Dothideomycetidae sp. 11243]|nr:hypothetical protein ANO11243_044420 [fungal sp. No.11243]